MGGSVLVTVRTTADTSPSAKVVADVEVNVDVGVLTTVWVVWLKEVEVEVHGANKVFVGTLSHSPQFTIHENSSSWIAYEDVKKFVISIGTCAVLTDPKEHGSIRPQIVRTHISAHLQPHSSKSPQSTRYTTQHRHQLNFHSLQVSKMPSTT